MFKELACEPFFFSLFVPTNAVAQQKLCFTCFLMLLCASARGIRRGKGQSNLTWKANVMSLIISTPVCKQKNKMCCCSANNGQSLSLCVSGSSQQECMALPQALLQSCCVSFLHSEQSCNLCNCYAPVSCGCNVENWLWLLCSAKNEKKLPK